MDTAAYLFVRCEPDPDAAMRQVWILQEVARDSHDDGDARLVVGAEERGPAGGDDVFAQLPGKVRKLLGRQHDAGLVGQDDRAACIVAMDDRLDTGSAELR